MPRSSPGEVGSRDQRNCELFALLEPDSPPVGADWSALPEEDGLRHDRPDGARAR